MVQNNQIYIERLEKEDDIQNGDLRTKNIEKIKNIDLNENIVKTNSPLDNFLDISQLNYERQRSYLGLILFVIIFTLFFSNLMHDYGYYAFLLGYLPNQDLVATVLTRWGGPFGIWANLYPENQSEIHTWASVNVINYIALLGLTYIVAKEVYEHNNLHLGWSMAFVMCLMTYLLPSPVITYVMDIVYNRFNHNNVLAIIAGFITVFLIVVCESYILHNFRPQLIKLSKTVIDLGNIF